MTKGIITAILSLTLIGGVIAIISIADERNTMTREYIDIQAVYDSYETKELTPKDDFKKSADTEIQFHEVIAYDTTGLYKYSIINTEEDIQNHAVEYYKAYFNSDDEIHFILNYSNDTVTQISKSGNQLYLITRSYNAWEQGFNIKDFTSGEEVDCYTVFI